jgi:hypothetical protein
MQNMFTVRQMTSRDTMRVKKFEEHFVYKECFSNTCDLQLYNTYKNCDITLLLLLGDNVVGIIQAIQPLKINMHMPVLDSLMIINFCVRKMHRSLGLGRMLFMRMMKLCNKTVFLTINKKEPLNDTKKLFEFYTKNLFRVTHEDDTFIYFQKSM